MCVRRLRGIQQGFCSKFDFYQRYGVEEYYLYDPDRGSLRGWQRRSGQLQEIAGINGRISPWLGVRFTLEGTELVLYRPDGRRFESFIELDQRAQRLAERLRAMGVDPDQL